MNTSRYLLGLSFALMIIVSSCVPSRRFSIPKKIPKSNGIASFGLGHYQTPEIPSDRVIDWLGIEYFSEGANEKEVTLYPTSILSGGYGINDYIDLQVQFVGLSQMSLHSTFQVLNGPLPLTVSLGSQFSLQGITLLKNEKVINSLMGEVSFGGSHVYVNYRWVRNYLNDYIPESYSGFSIGFTTRDLSKSDFWDTKSFVVIEITQFNMNGKPYYSPAIALIIPIKPS